MRCSVLGVAAAWLLAATPSAAEAPRLAGDEFRVNTQTDGIQQSACVAIDARGNFVVAWQSEVPGHGDEIRARRFDARGAPQSPEIAVNSVSAGHQDAPAIAMAPDGGFVVAWQTIVESNLQIRVRRFDANGQPQGGELPVNTRTGNANSDPAIAIDGRGNFVVAWESTIDGSYEIRARRFDAQGAAQGGELAINGDTASSQRGPALAMGADGRFVVAWRSNLDGSFEVRARRFERQGAALGDELGVNTTRAGDQVAPAVAMAADGSFVVAWENSFDSDYDIRARRFDAKGVARGDEFGVQPGSGEQQFAPALALAKSGDLLVAWQSFAGGDVDVRARAYAANGLPLSEDVAVNSVSAGTQKNPALALSSSGEFVAAWHGDSAGTWDIQARTGTLRAARVTRASRARPKPSY